MSNQASEGSSARGGLRTFNATVRRNEMEKILLVIALLLMIASGAFYMYRARSVSCSQPCWGKLANMEAAKNQWALDHKAVSGANVTIEDIEPYLKGGMPTCHVANAGYILGKVGEEPRCTVHGTISHFKYDRIR